MGLMGLDIGTTGCKATIFDFEGSIKASAYREYGIQSPAPELRELNPDMVWESVKHVIKSSVSDYNGEKLKAISISSIGEASIPIDIKGNVLYNSILFFDSRGEKEISVLREKLGEEKVQQITGTFIHPMFSVGKIMWLKNHKRDVYDSTWKFLPFEGFILHKLGAGPYTDFSLAARTMAFDVVNKQWSEIITGCAEIDVAKLPEPVQSGTVLSEISSAAAEELGLPKGILLVSGGHDQTCAALGAGVLKSNIAVDGMGTVECITPAFDKPVISKKMAQNYFACIPHVKKDMYVTYAFNFTGGGLLKWYRNNFANREMSLAEKQGLDAYSLMIEGATRFPTNIYILPHFSGTGTPYMDISSKGAILGLTMETTKSDIIKAILEGTTYEMMVNLERLHDSGIHIDELRTVGGGSRSEYWLQLKADMMGKKITTLNVSEAGTLGTAILAGTAAGIYSSLEDAASKLIKVKKEFYPDDRMHSIYKEKFNTYKRIYPAVKSVITP